MDNIIKRLGNDKLLNFDEIKEICFNDLDYEKCSDIIIDIKEISNPNSLCTARFNHYARTIYFDVSNMHSMSQKCVQLFIDEYGFNEKYRNIFENFFYLVTIFHEVKHVVDFKKYWNSGFNDFLKYIYSISEDMKVRRDLYFQYNLCYPTERSAEITGYIKSLNLFSNLDLNKNDLLVLQKFIIFLLTSNYEKNKDNKYLSPFEILLMKYDPMELEKNFDLIYNSINDYDIYFRAIYGLPLSKNEISEIDELCHLRKTIDISKRLIKK